MGFFDDKKEEEKVEEEKKEEKQEEIKTYKVGEKEYTQDDLAKLVGLGEIAREAETKYNRKIDQFWPDYTKTKQELDEIKKAKQAEEAKKVEEKKTKGEELTPDELRKQAVLQLKSLFEEPELKQYLDEKYIVQKQADKLVEDCQAVIEEAREKGWPKETPEGIINYMTDTGIRNPLKAYKDKYEKEIDTWKEAQMKKIKPGSFSTIHQSTAGSEKLPSATKVTKENLKSVLKDFLASRQQV